MAVFFVKVADITAGVSVFPASVDDRLDISRVSSVLGVSQG
jgi:hypothetical protein